MKKVASIFGATLFGIFTSVTNAGSPIALTESEMDAVTAGVGFTSNTFATLPENIEELIVEEKALSFPSFSAAEEYRQTLNLSESTKGFFYVITGWQSTYRDVIDQRLDY